MTHPLQTVLLLTPEYRSYVWGGHRLKPDGSLVAEAWVVYAGDRIANGPCAGRTLGELATEYGSTLLGRKVVARFGTRFPLLIKLLDCAQWLSLQVHPNDEQAVQLEGAGHVGKTEAWHILDAAQDATIIAGIKPGVAPEAFAHSVRDGTILDHVQYVPVKPGDTVYMPAGTVHALGPGLLVYEVQQASDITYRVFDWNRPPTAGRVLHIDQSLAVANPGAAGQARPLPPLQDGEARTLCECPYFTLQMLDATNASVELDTAGESFHALTVIEGALSLATGNESLLLERFETVLAPASCGRYRLEPRGHVRVLWASVAG